jgi:hypothetical protein
MRLWSLSPSYLDKQGLCGLWKETLLGQACLLKGEYIECPRCLGSGIWSRTGMCLDTEDCYKCKGTGKIKTPYWGHPQLLRFKQNEKGLYFIEQYLYAIRQEGIKRGYKFDLSRIKTFKREKLLNNFLIVTKGQIEYEFKHLQEKLFSRYITKYKENRYTKPILPNPIFKVIDGSVESWERIR